MMKPKIAVVIVFLLSLAATLRASAQMFGMSAPEVRGVFNPVVGSGASYGTVGNDGKKMEFEITIVDKDPSGGYWMEYSVPDSQGTVYIKYLISRQGNDAIIQHTIFQTPGQPPIDATTTLSMQGMRSPKQNQKIDFRSEAQNLGTESITTPAGTFSCQHWRHEGGHGHLDQRQGHSLGAGKNERHASRDDHFSPRHYWCEEPYYRYAHKC